MRLLIGTYLISMVAVGAYAWRILGQADAERAMIDDALWRCKLSYWKARAHARSYHD